MYITNIKNLKANPRFGISKKEYNQYLFNCFLRRFGRNLEQEHSQILVMDGEQVHIIKNELGREQSCISLEKIQEFV